MNKKTVILIRNAKAYDFGGGERFPVFLGAILAKHGISPLVVSRSKKLLAFAKEYEVPALSGWWWSRQSWSGPRVVLFPIYIVWQLLLFGWYLQLFIRTCPQAVHIQSKDDFIAATWAGRLCGSNVIWTDHADLKHIWRNLDVWYKNPIGKLVYLAAHCADTITLVSESERHLVMANLPVNTSLTTKISVIYNGVSDTMQAYTQTNKHNPFTFCVASRLVKDKGIGEIISAYTNLSSRFPDSRLILMGDGPDKKQFVHQAAGSRRIVFMGHQNNPLTYIADADVFVHPTYHEGFSVALVEASMLAKPIIATAVGGNVEIIHDGTTGLLVKPRDVQSLEVALERLIQDERLRKKLAIGARTQYEERFDFDRIVVASFIPLYKGGIK